MIINLAQLLFMLPVLILFFAGIALIAVPSFTKKRRLKTCTNEVTARCVRLEYPNERVDDSLCHPVWEVEVNGHMVEYCHKNVFFAGVTVEKGEERKIYINPNNTEEYYDPEDKSGARVFYIVGGCMIAFAIIIILSGFIPK